LLKVMDQESLVARNLVREAPPNKALNPPIGRGRPLAGERHSDSTDKRPATVNAILARAPAVWTQGFGLDETTTLGLQAQVHLPRCGLARLLFCWRARALMRLNGESQQPCPPMPHHKVDGDYRYVA
jgi:hypothetical protein